MDTRVCRKCNAELSIENFSRNAPSAGGRLWSCKKCVSAAAKEWRSRPEVAEMLREYFRDHYVANADAIKKRAAKYYRREEVVPKLKAYRSARASRKEYAEKQREWAGKYRRSAHGRAVRAASLAKRRALELLATPPWADQVEIVELYKKASELTSTTGVEHEVDHVVPLRSPMVCGLHWEGNLQVVPAIENNRKNNKWWPDMPTDFTQAFQK